MLVLEIGEPALREARMVRRAQMLDFISVVGEDDSAID